MAEGVHRNIGVELTVDAVQEVKVELGGYSLRIVIGGDQPVDRLDPVHADQKPCPGTKNGAEVPEQIGRAPGHEIANGRAREEAEPAKIVNFAGKPDLLG